MNALVRYVVMKGLREQFIQTLLLAPAVMFVTPLLVFGVWNVFRGRAAWPLTLPGALTPEASANVLTLPSIFMAAIAAGTASFWVFRTEMSGRTIGFFFLAQHTMLVPLTAMLFGTIIGIGSYTIGVGLLGILTQAPMSMAATTAMAAVSTVLVAAAVGTFAIGTSSEQSVLIPVYVIICATAATLLNSESTAVLAAAVAAAVLVTLAAPLVWRRRCAA